MSVLAKGEHDTWTCMTLPHVKSRHWALMGARPADKWKFCRIMPLIGRCSMFLFLAPGSYYFSCRLTDAEMNYEFGWQYIPNHAERGININSEKLTRDPPN